MYKKPKRLRHAFPLEFSKLLVVRSVDQTRLVGMMAKRGYRISKQFISMMASGDRNVPPEQLKRICETLQVDVVEKERLHRAAAIDHGYELGPVA